MSDETKSPDLKALRMSVDALLDPRRVAACVHACAGLPTEALESGALGKVLDLLGLALEGVDSFPSSHPCLRDDLHDQLSGAGGLDALTGALRALGRLP